MKIVNIIGGLGNQMFQYALALALRERYVEEKILIDISGFNGYPLHNGYELKIIFNVDIPEASIKQQLSVCYPLRNYRMWQFGRKLLPKRKSIIIENIDKQFDKSVLDRNSSAYYLGYWQTEKYFFDIRETVLNAFTFPSIDVDTANFNLIGYIRDKVTVSVHVRRGDYLKINNAQGICTIDYYQKAITKIKKSVNPDIFLIFSDDIDWCQQNLGDLFNPTETIYVDWNKGENSYRDMQIMSLCKHNVIANSSFSWWGAWLNRNPSKIVVSPSVWMNGGGLHDIIPENWIKVN